MAESHVKVMLLACVAIFKDGMELRADLNVRDTLVKVVCLFKAQWVIILIISCNFEKRSEFCSKSMPVFCVILTI
jgi:hypothetical protein